MALAALTVDPRNLEPEGMQAVACAVDRLVRRFHIACHDCKLPDHLTRALTDSGIRRR